MTANTGRDENDYWIINLLLIGTLPTSYLYTIAISFSASRDNPSRKVRTISA